MTDKTMTLRQIDEMIHATKSAQDITESIRHLSQPAERVEVQEKAEQVAFDEAVKRAGERACGAQTQVPRDLSPGKAWEWMAREMLLAAGNYTAPPPAAGVPNARVVPYGSASGEKDYAYGYEKGHADGWNACRAAMLSATPSPTIDVAAVRRVHDLLEIEGEHELADKLARALGDAK